MGSEILGPLFDTMILDTNYKKRVSPLFILGVPRSGTTLVQSLLDGHSQLLSDVYDCRFFNAYYPVAKNKTYEQKLKLADKHLISYVFNPPSQYYQDFVSHVSILALKDEFNKQIKASPKRAKDFLDAYIFALGVVSETLHQDTRYWVSKILHGEYGYPRLRAWWPNAKYIIMFRDPRDIYTSYKTRDIKNNRKITSIEGFASGWARFIHAVNDHRLAVGKRNCYILQYETLVDEFEKTVADVTSFLNIDDLPSLYTPTKGHGRVPWGGNRASGEKSFKINRKAIGKWQNKLSEEEVHKIESLLSREMKMAGYSPDNVERDLKIYAIAKFKIRLRHVLYNLRHFGL